MYILDTLKASRLSPQCKKEGNYAFDAFDVLDAFDPVNALHLLFFMHLMHSIIIGLSIFNDPPGIVECYAKVL